MATGVNVLVCGGDETTVAETAAALEERGGMAVQTATGAVAADEVGSVDCVVSVDSDLSEVATALRARSPSLPIVVFDSGGPETVQHALAGGATDYVQRGTDEQYAVLVHRVERAADAYTSYDADTEFDRYEEVISALDDGVYALDDQGQFVFVNEAMADLTGYPTEELLGEHTGVIKDRGTVELAESKLASLLSSSGPEDVETTFELEIRPKDGQPFPCEDHMTVLYGPNGRFRGTAGVIRDITERKRREEMLSELQETSRALMQAPSREAVADIVSSAAETVLGMDLNVVRLYDADTQTLWPAATSGRADDLLGDRPVYGIDEGRPGEVFATGEPATYDDIVEDGTEFRSAMYFPIGVHGVLSVMSTEADAFDDIDHMVVDLLTTNAAAACNRAKREQEVRETRERIAAILERINGLVEDTIGVLVEATTREEVETGVCEQVAATDPYVFAWIARPNVRSDRLEARAWAGDAAVEVDDVTVPTDADEPGARALASQEPEILTELDSVEAEWGPRARAAGVESVMAIPLSYTDSTYGVLYVCSDQSDAFDEREQVVLEALGQAVANAINAIESGKILSADRVVELEFTVDDRDLPLSRLSASTGADLESEGTVINDDGTLRMYLTAEGGDTDAVLDALETDESVRSVKPIVEHEGDALFDITLTESLVARLADHGAVTTGVTAADGVARYTIELPYETEAREVFGLVEDSYDRTDLVGYHEHERPVQTRQEFRASLSERFTDRQETALRTAYLGGFFDWPREIDGDELATAMDISRPTYHQHLRAAQQKVFEELFE
ncbi:bacterio-opsin activator domain-containing protein [Haloarcula sp. GH36]|uniref:bacterio-opsin activator domain-containing protein n=1 Tax=Haloarcula montana TaxID=3111776 RepID=UPI002D7A38E5|nr:bacterio-opsin activator domain-containing protein [Haloarcula sp. GH36]